MNEFSLTRVIRCLKRERDQAFRGFEVDKHTDLFTYLHTSLYIDLRKGT